jgi:hypothetical protein
MLTVAVVSGVTPVLSRSVEPKPVVPICSENFVGPRPLVQVNFWLVDKIPEDGVSVAGVGDPGSVKVYSDVCQAPLMI